MDSEDIIDRKCDILIMASQPNLINTENAEYLNCKVLVEASNGSTTALADKILNDKNILVVPDIIGNSGALISSYTEWLKNIQHKSLGRLTRKWEEKSKRALLSGLQSKL